MYSQCGMAAVQTADPHLAAVVVTRHFPWLGGATEYQAAGALVLLCACSVEVHILTSGLHTSAREQRMTQRVSLCCCCRRVFGWAEAQMHVKPQ